MHVEISNSGSTSTQVLPQWNVKGSLYNIGIRVIPHANCAKILVIHNFLGCEITCPGAKNTGNSHAEIQSSRQVIAHVKILIISHASCKSRVIPQCVITVGPKTFFLFHLRGSPRELINAGVKKLNWKRCNHSFTSGGSGINYTGMKKAELKKDARFFHLRWRGLGFINCGGERKNWGPTRPRFMSESGTAQNRWKTISKTAFWNNANPVPEMLINTVEFYIILRTLREKWWIW